MKVYNQFWFPGKVPSMNELLDGKANARQMKKTWLVHKGKKPGQFKFNKYNQIKQDWTQKVVNVVKSTGFCPTEASYFCYLVVEKTRKRDPSNVFSSACKFIEDGLMEAGVIPNDGWNNVLGIATYIKHEPLGEAGVYLVMSDAYIMPCTMDTFYANAKR
jgi:hypothetical protein